MNLIAYVVNVCLAMSGTSLCVKLSDREFEWKNYQFSRIVSHSRPLTKTGHLQDKEDTEEIDGNVGVKIVVENYSDMILANPTSQVECGYKVDK